MLNNRTCSIILVTLLLITSCSTRTKREYRQIRGFAQGTTFNIQYYHPQNRDLSDPIGQILERIDSSMSVYRDNSIINAFNASQEGIEVDSLLAQVVEQSLQCHRQTNGAFDITVGPLVKAWGFYARQNQVPSDDTIAHLMGFIGDGMIALDGLFLGKKHAEVKIDVNAIAPGFTVDRIAAYFEKIGIKDYLVEVGGELRSLGNSPRGTPWRVGIDRPDDHAVSGENLQAIIEISGQSLVTSGNYRKFFMKDGVRYSHTIDPTTGRPVEHSLLSATVLDSTSARADALATAFMVMGKDKAIQWLQANPGVEVYLIYSDEKGNYQVWMSEGIKKRIVD